MLPWLMAVLAAGRAGGQDVIDGVFTDLVDTEGFAAECRQGRDCGFDGKSLIHPGQIAMVNQCFAPDEAELAFARRIAGLFDQPGHAGLGVVAFEGKMVERLHAEAARRLLARARAIEARGF
jgi:citrate lyase subunit beta/citryl-CoA lyase